MKPNLRKFALTAHIALSGGWIGAVFAYLLLVVAAITSESDQTLRGAWIAMELIGWYLIVPLALATLPTGLVMSLGTRWGLFRHYWVLSSFMLTTVATVVLLQHMPTVSAFASAAAIADSANVSGLRGALRGELLHAGVGVLLLLAIQALNVYKPQGMTGFGVQKASSQAALPLRLQRRRRAETGPRSYRQNTAVGAGGRDPRHRPGAAVRGVSSRARGHG
jgi:hypothetical protein